MHKTISSFLWLAPFGAFIIGYLCIALLMNQKPFSLPSYIGNNLTHALIDLSQKKLVAQVVKTKLDSDLPEGTILEQAPRAGNQVKKNQTIFFVISQRPGTTIAPSYLGRKIKNDGILTQDVHSLYASAPEGTYFAQYPTAGTPLENNTMICYCSRGEFPYCLMPDYIGMTVHDIEEHLTARNCTYEISFAKNTLRRERQKITAQMPLAGTIIRKDQPLSLQLVAQ